MQRKNYCKEAKTTTTITFIEETQCAYSKQKNYIKWFNIYLRGIVKLNVNNIIFKMLSSFFYS